MFRGKVWILGNNIDTDMIISGKYLSFTDPSFLAEHCLEGIEKGWSNKIAKGDILIAGKNFGCGSSREHAVVALKAAGISCIIAESFGAIFFRNFINLGLAAIELRDASKRFNEGDMVEVDLEAGKARNMATQKTYPFPPMPSIVLDILKAGGLLHFIGKTNPNNFPASYLRSALSS
ncbi:MAG: 3-isopropylmalate dehydratase small subunit [Deltaproteobacteria bacterium]|nr:3-isopropylmalate dehydratase small subunit [Deltaproteobacteria bacterium]